MSDTFAKDTSNRSKKDWAIALIVLFTGLVIAHLGVSMFLVSAMGTDTFTVFIQGLALTCQKITGTGFPTVGTVHVIILCLIMVIMLFTTKGYIKPGTVICAFCGGPIIDFFNWLISPFVNEGSPLAVRAVVMVLGCVILSVGMSVVINSEAGTGPNDLIAIVISDKLPKVQFRFVRIACDIFFIVIGFLLGGIVGIGTVVAAFLTGPLVQFWLPKTKAVIRRLPYQ
ncbi:MAG: YitT family protein [Lachnospiraceae bacterium]